MADTLKFRVATEPWEFEQINKLNYETFVEEIPHHLANSHRMLSDKFHSENSYIICVNGDKKVLGMLAVRDKRPFSLDNKLENLDSYLPPNRSMCEVRLLAARKSARHSRVVHGLMKEVISYCLGRGYDLALISGYLGQQKLYKHMGFMPFGPVVGTEKARFQPMYLTPEAYSTSKKPAIRIEEIVAKPKTYLLPGPVKVSPEVKSAFAQSVVSHRSKEFMGVLEELKERLCGLVNAKGVELFMGSGTLANNVLAGQLSLLEGTGLILSNGEFGNRLIECAKGFRLNFKTLSNEWGTPFSRQKIEDALDADPTIEWVWAVHHETSTGMLNDLAMLKDAAAKRNIKLCVDCVSSIGCVEVDLAGVYLASGVSGKGLRCYAGLALVFYNYDAQPARDRLPCYLDLGYYRKCDGVPFTVNSNLIYALYAATEDIDIRARHARTLELSNWLRSELAGLDLKVLVGPEYACPNVLTICPGEKLSCEELGDALLEKGYSTSYRSYYLLSHNWLQLCLMSEFSKEQLTEVITLIEQLTSR